MFPNFSREIDASQIRATETQSLQKTAEYAKIRQPNYDIEQEPAKGNKLHQQTY